ncbi:MAG TPA: DinB family protein [Holophagaceae bacterium]|nr:DinB family protein [Holophagaceae bacterium]
MPDSSTPPLSTVPALARARTPSGRPGPGEFADYAAADIALVPGEDAVAALAQQTSYTLALLAHISDAEAGRCSYAPGKWTLKQILGHLTDDERIFGYRMLCLARKDPAALPGFDENLYVRSAGFEGRTWVSLMSEYQAVRESSLVFLKTLSPEAWLRRGTVNGYEASVRGLAFHIVGHELHHLDVIRERYLPLL